MNFETKVDCFCFLLIFNILNNFFLNYFLYSVSKKIQKKVQKRPKAFSTDSLEKNFESSDSLEKQTNSQRVVAVSHPGRVSLIVTQQGWAALRTAKRIMQRGLSARQRSAVWRDSRLRWKTFALASQWKILTTFREKSLLS